MLITFFTKESYNFCVHELQVSLTKFQLFWMKFDWDFDIKTEKYMSHAELPEKKAFLLARR